MTDGNTSKVLEVAREIRKLQQHEMATQLVADVVDPAVRKYLYEWLVRKPPQELRKHLLLKPTPQGYA